MRIQDSIRGTDVRRLSACALMAALTAVCSQIQIPLPAIPINLALFAVHLSGALLGAAGGALSMVVYVLLGISGVPVFAGFQAGPAVLFGKTGGYILGYFLCAFLVGFLSRKRPYTYPRLCLAMAAGVFVCYFFGTGWFMLLSGMSLSSSLSLCVVPFLPGDAVKVFMAAFLAVRMRPILTRMGFFF
ncbi:MAG: biotin transporter BioY [Clostridiales bacterium]|nr:biotin transporter BioY [Clostridiales bacterium]